MEKVNSMSIFRRVCMSNVTYIFCNMHWRTKTSEKIFLPLKNILKISKTYQFNVIGSRDK